MRISITIYKENEGTPFRKMNIRANTHTELAESVEDVIEFLNECFDEIEEEDGL